MTGGPVLTGVAEALVHIGVAMDARKAGCTVAFVGALFVFANAIAAYLRGYRTLIHILDAIASGPASRTLALIVAIGQVGADAAIAAGLGGTLCAYFVLGTNAFVLRAHHGILAVGQCAGLHFLTPVS